MSTCKGSYINYKKKTLTPVAQEIALRQAYYSNANLGNKNSTTASQEKTPINAIAMPMLYQLLSNTLLVVNYVKYIYLTSSKLNKLSSFNALSLNASQPSIQEHVIVIALLYRWPITQMTSIVSLHCFSHDMCTRMPEHCFAYRK